MRKAHPSWGPKKLWDVVGRLDPERDLPAISTAAKILADVGLVKPTPRILTSFPLEFSRGTGQRG